MLNYATQSNLKPALVLHAVPHVTFYLLAQVLDYLIRVHNTFIDALKDADHAVIVPSSVTEEALVRDVTKEFAEIVSMYELSPEEAAALPGNPSFLLDRMIASVRCCSLV